MQANRFDISAQREELIIDSVIVWAECAGGEDVGFAFVDLHESALGEVAVVDGRFKFKIALSGNIENGINAPSLIFKKRSIGAHRQWKKYLKKREAEIDLYKTVSPSLRPYYRKLVEQYHRGLKGK